MARSLSSPGEQSATFVELFFDLVFVFCITQIVGLLHEGLTAEHIAHAVVVFWLVWWAWTQFTWALNAADTTHPHVELATMAATAVAFFMAVAVPESFGNRALGFGITYVAVRGLGLWIYGRVAASNPAQREAVRRFALASTAGMVAVVAGAFAGPELQLWIWTGAIVLDIGAAAVGVAVSGWDLHAEHFAERHGLIVIIALGESLIVAAAGLADHAFEGALVLVATLGVLITCGLWWTYFPVAKPELEHALASVPEVRQAALARDVFSLAHFPMLCGVVAYAVALEEAVAHPLEPLPLPTRLALALGIVLFVGGTALAMWRATCGRPVARVAIVVATGVAVVLPGTLPAPASFATAFAGVALIAFLDERRADRLGAP